MTMREGRMRVFLSERDRRLNHQQAEWSFCAEEALPGHFALFNRNADTTWHVRVVEQCANRYGWILDVETVPAYWQAVLTQEE